MINQPMSYLQESATSALSRLENGDEVQQLKIIIFYPSDVFW